MVARLLKLLLLLQAVAVAVLCYAAWRYWEVQPLALALALAVLGLLAARVLITANNFWLGWRYGSATPPRFRLGWGQALRMFFDEFGATMMHSSWSMARAAAGRSIVADAAGLPVLLIHGYGCNSGYWAHLIPRLDAARISHATLDLEPVTGDIDGYVGMVDAAVRELCAATGCQKVIVVAHSMGGLVARAYLRAHGAARVARVITLGTPHHGTSLANFGVGHNAVQMRRTLRGGASAESTWLRALAATEDVHSRALITSLYSHHDNIVAPQSSCELPGARNIAFGGIGHVALGRNRAILEAVMAEIARAADQFASAAPRRRSAQ